uniref:Glycosyl transferase family 25 domain-containing protein n=1 Tax=viral metagenome TaxID=1070528 RepID=A0A6C0I403_9ZZZZ
MTEMTTITISDIPGYYINLNSRVDRKQHVERQLDLLGIRDNVKRFNAIHNVNGRIGCSLSHLKCIQMAKEQNMEFVLILEDDVSFLLPDDFVENVNKFLSNPKNKWDVLLLAGNNLPPFTTNDEVSIRVTHCQTTTGYIVRKHYYDTLISNIKEGVAKLMKNPEHHYYFAIDKYWIHLQKQHRWMLLVPLIVVQRPDYSDIEKRHTDYQHLMTSIDKSDVRRVDN